MNAGRQEHSAATGTHREEEEANTGRQEHAAAATTGTNHNQNQDCIHRKEGGAPTSEGQEYQEEEIGEANRKDMVQPLPSLSAILLLNLEACTYSLVRDVKDAALFLRLNVGHLFVCICRDGFSRRRDEEMDWRHSHRGEGIANPTESPTADMPPGSYAFLILCRASMFTCGSIGLTRRLLFSANSLP